jgi:hypothetical protein
VLLVDLLDHVEAGDAKCYCGTTERLRQAIHHKRTGLLIHGIITSQDNTTFHNTNRTGDWLGRYNWEIMDLPPCSSSLVSGYLHLFGPLTKDLVDKHLATDDDMKQAVTS